MWRDSFAPPTPLGKARALSKGRDHLALEDVKTLAKAVFRHRIHLSFEGETEGVTPDAIVETILEEVSFEKDMD